MQRSTFAQETKKFFLMAASFALAIVLLGGVKAAAASTEVTTDQGTFTIGYGGSGYNKYDAPTVIGYKGSDSDVTLPTKVTINDTEQDITILGEAFKSNTAITSVTIPEGYTSIGISALSGCSGLTSITIPGSLQVIGATAFENCTKLTTVNFTENENGTLKFMNKVFNGCTSLESINLPVQTTSVYDNGNIFTGCTALKNITVSSGNTTYSVENGALYGKNEEGTAVTLCTYVSAPAELTLPDTVGGLSLTAIGPMAFQKNTTLTSVTLPASVTTIERLAFDTCSNLKTVVLLCETAPSLGSYAFSDLAADSVIYVANETVAAAFTSSNYSTGKTTVQVGTPSATTAASVSLKAAGYADGKVSFDLYLDSATELNTLMFQLTFNAAQVTEGTVTVADSSFTNNNFQWSEADGTLTAVLQFGKTGDENLTYEESVKLATITLPLKDGVTGNITATISKAAAAGAGEDAGPQVDAAITTATASVFIASYDVNGDGKIDLKDIAEAQRYYQAKTGDENWTKAQTADVNGDGVVDIQDYIALFHAVVDAMGW
mgnify:CR=1 FL=1